jgi:hypothetical protein
VPIAVHGSRYREWRVEFPAGTRLSSAPGLRFSAPPQRLQILANGRGPYRLVRTQTPDHANPHMRGVFASLGLDETASATLVSASPAIRPEQVDTTKNHRPLYVFWALLISASALMLFFAWRLLRQKPVVKPES